MYFIFHFICSQCVAFYRYLFMANMLHQDKFSFPIISVGNISLGGTGKTPFIYYLAQVCNKLKIKHVIVSRGYKKLSSGTCVVHDGKQTLCYDPLITGDEPLMLALKLKTTPIIVDNKKNRALHYVEQAFPQHMVLLEDSFQSHYIRKTFELVLFNCLVQKKDLRFFPFGKLREPLSGLSRAHFVVFTKHNLSIKENEAVHSALSVVKKNNIPYLYSNISSSISKHSINKVQPLEWKQTSLKKLPKKNILLLCCGIGDPQSFIQTSQQYEPNICQSLLFSDHYNYAQNEQSFMQKIKLLYIKHGFSGLLTTDKDFIKIKNLSLKSIQWFAEIKLQFFIVDIKIHLIEEDKLIRHIKSLGP